VWRVGHGVIRKIGRCSHYGHSHIRSNPDGNHILIHTFTQADPGIKTPFDDIDKTIINDKFNIDFRIFSEEGF